MTKNNTLGLVFLALLLVQGMFFAGDTSLVRSLDSLFGAVAPSLVVSETNELRRANGVGSLTYSDALQKSAQAKAEDMARERYFAHTSPKGVTPWAWFKKADYAYIYAGENLAVHYDESVEVVRAWMQSKTHRDTMLAGKYTEVGIGVAEGYFEGRNAVFVVEHLGTQLPATATRDTDAVEIYSGGKDARVLAAVDVAPYGAPVGALRFALFGLTTFGGLFYSLRAFIHAYHREHAQHLIYASFILIFTVIVYITTLFL